MKKGVGNYLTIFFIDIHNTEALSACLDFSRWHIIPDWSGRREVELAGSIGLSGMISATTVKDIAIYTNPQRREE